MAVSVRYPMISSVILRSRLREVIFGYSKVFAVSMPHCWLSSDSSSSDDEPVQESKLRKEESLKNRLSKLLSSLEVEPSIPPGKSTITLNLAKPKNRRQRSVKTDKFGMHGQQTPKDEEQHSSSTGQQTPKDEEQHSSSTSSPGVDEKLVVAAKHVASTLKGDKKTIELELLKTLKMHADETEKAKCTSSIDVSDIFVGMKIDRRKESIPPRSTTIYPINRREAFSPQEQEMNGTSAAVNLRWKRVQTTTRRTRVDLYNAPRLDIFNIPTEKIKTDFPKNEIWDKLVEHELELLVTHPARNGFEEMINWTEERKLWVFPIDNEYGLEEKNIAFHEHVFLDHLLEGFPEKGPIRHFMELVINGLSKNPYITVERKKEHVEWYRNYFKDKEMTLREAVALVE